MGCRELRSTKYISDGQCTSVQPIKELVCAGECLPAPHAAQLDRREPREEVLEPAEQPGLALRQRQDADAAHPATVPGRQRPHLQDHRGDRLQVQAVLTAAQRVRQQAGGTGVAAGDPGGPQAQVQEQEEAGEETA